MRYGSPIAERVLAVLAAICVVVAFALAVMLPAMMPLSRLIAMASQDLLVALQNDVRSGLSEWTWRAVFLPVLLRPCWLLPLTLGLIFGGISLTLASRRRVPGSPRWRN